MGMDRPLFTADRFSPERKARNRRTIKRRIRQAAKDHRPEVLERDGGRCVWCGATESLTMDHVIPVFEWINRPFAEHRQFMGPENLRTLCAPCHHARNLTHPGSSP